MLQIGVAVENVLYGPYRSEDAQESDVPLHSFFVYGVQPVNGVDIEIPVCYHFNDQVASVRPRSPQPSLGQHVVATAQPLMRLTP